MPFSHWLISFSLSAVFMATLSRILLLAVLSLHWCFAQPTKAMSKHDLLTDLVHLEAFLLATYAGALIPGHQSPSLQGYMDSLQTVLPDEISASDYVWYVREAVFRTRDVHVYLMKTPPTEIEDTTKWNLLPFRFGIFGDVIQSCTKTPDGKIRPGDTLTSINGHSAAEIRYKLSHYYPTDYPESVNMGVGLTNNRPQWLFFRVFGGQPVTEVYVKHGSRKSVVRIPSVKKELPIAPPALPETFHPVEDSLIDLPLWYDKRKDMIYFKVESSFFRSSKTGEYLKLRQFLDRTNPQALMIDLRGVMGGNLAHAQMLSAVLSGRANTLLQYLESDSAAQKRLHNFQDQTQRSGQTIFTAYKADNLVRFVCNPRVKGPYKGQVLVLCDGTTASAAAFTATWLNYFCRARIIGTETGGSNYACTTHDNNPVTEVLTLPNSGIQVHIPSGATIFFTEPGERSSGLKPHVAVAPTALDIASGTDPVLTTAIREVLEQ